MEFMTSNAAAVTIAGSKVEEYLDNKLSSLRKVLQRVLGIQRREARVLGEEHLDVGRGESPNRQTGESPNRQIGDCQSATVQSPRLC